MSAVVRYRWVQPEDSAVWVLRVDEGPDQPERDVARVYRIDGPTAYRAVWAVSDDREIATESRLGDARRAAEVAALPKGSIPWYVIERQGYSSHPWRVLVGTEQLYEPGDFDHPTLGRARLMSPVAFDTRREAYAWMMRRLGHRTERPGVGRCLDCGRPARTVEVCPTPTPNGGTS